MNTDVNVVPEPYNTVIQLKRFCRKGRPKGRIRRASDYILTRHPHIKPRYLQQLLQHQLKQPITRNYSKQLTYRYRQQNNNIGNNNRQNQHSQLYSNDIYDIIYDYIFHKEAQNKRYFNALTSVLGKGYTIHMGQPLWRYDNNMALTVMDNNYRLREPIRRLRDRETFIMKNHRHQHNTRQQRIEYHVGCHDLTKFLCNENYLDIPYKSRIYGGKGHFISTDASGLDICHIECFKKLLNNSLQGKSGKQLLEASFLHGKMLVGNETICRW